MQRRDFAEHKKKQESDGEKLDRVIQAQCDLRRLLLSAIKAGALTGAAGGDDGYLESSTFGSPSATSEDSSDTGDDEGSSSSQLRTPLNEIRTVAASTERVVSMLH